MRVCVNGKFSLLNGIPKDYQVNDSMPNGHMPRRYSAFKKCSASFIVFGRAISMWKELLTGNHNWRIALMIIVKGKFNIQSSISDGEGIIALLKALRNQPNRTSRSFIDSVKESSFFFSNENKQQFK